MDEREVLRGRIRDLWNRTREGEYLNHTGFLPLDLQSYARRLIREDKIPERSGSGPFCMFSGGFEEADRKMILFVPSYMNEEDVKAELAKGEGAFTCVRIAAVRSGFSAPPDHRDYLGSLMNLGITREQIGSFRICGERDGSVYMRRTDQSQTYHRDSRNKGSFGVPMRGSDQKRERKRFLRESGLPRRACVPSLQIPGFTPDRAGEGIC